MSSALRLVNGAASSAAKSVVSPAQAAAQTVARRAPSPRQQIVNQRLRMLSKLWPQLSDSERQSFFRLGQRYSVNATKSTSSGKSLFVSLNFTRLIAGMDILRSVGVLPEATIEIPDYTLAATRTGDALAITIAPAIAYAGLARLMAIRPQSPGVTVLDKSKYQDIEVFSSLPGGATLDITSAFTAVFGPADVGNRVGVCLTPISPMGFLGAPLYHDTLVVAG